MKAQKQTKLAMGLVRQVACDHRDTGRPWQAELKADHQQGRQEHGNGRKPMESFLAASQQEQEDRERRQDDRRLLDESGQNEHQRAIDSSAQACRPQGDRTGRERQGKRQQVGLCNDCAHGLGVEGMERK